jgi:hypothetical protein
LLLQQHVVCAALFEPLLFGMDFIGTLLLQLLLRAALIELPLRGEARIEALLGGTLLVEDLIDVLLVEPLLVEPLLVEALLVEALLVEALLVEVLLLELLLLQSLLFARCVEPVLLGAAVVEPLLFEMFFGAMRVEPAFFGKPLLAVTFGNPVVFRVDAQQHARRRVVRGGHERLTMCAGRKCRAGQSGEGAHGNAHGRGPLSVDGMPRERHGVATAYGQLPCQHGHGAKQMHVQRIRQRPRRSAAMTREACRARFRTARRHRSCGFLHNPSRAARAPRMPACYQHATLC